MKKRHILLLAMIPILSFSQGFQGKATYKTHKNIDLKITQNGNAPSAEAQKQFEEQLKKQFQKTYTLNFTQAESTYKQEEELKAPQPQASGVQIEIMGSGGHDILYKNIKENCYVNKTEIMSKLFLIKDSIANRNWELTGETKNIGQYTCYKATASKTHEFTDITVQDGETKEEKKTRTIVITAWYTPQIPVNNGPSDYDGLPGLILEINEDKLTIVCSEIVLNPQEKIVIEEPTKGKVVSQKEFDEIMDKKQKEMMEHFRSNNRGKKDGDIIEIRISN